MILEDLGVLDIANALVDGAEDSENVILLPAVANLGYTEIWLSIQVVVAAGGGTSSTYKFQLVMANESTLDTIVEVCSVLITGAADSRLAAINRNIAAFEVGQMIGEIADATKIYLGLIHTLANGNGTATLTVNSALSPSKPATKANVQVIRSNVGVPT